MKPRSRHLLRHMAPLGLAGLLGCGQPNGADLNAVPQAKAGCEDITDALTATTVDMMPGRDCGACHHAGGQATNSPWTVSGTIFAKPDSPCNTGGLANWVVQIKDSKGNTQQLTTSTTGNFYTTTHFIDPLSISMWDSKAPSQVYQMQTLVGLDPNNPTKSVLVNCNGCHQRPPQQGAPGRVYPAPSALVMPMM